MSNTNTPAKDNIDLLELANIGKNLRFNSHVKIISCTKVNNQTNLISRFRKIVPTDVKCKLYKVFIVPNFRYCTAVWHFCGARNRHIFENLNKRALRIVLDERSLHLTWNHWASLIPLICIISGAKTWWKQFLRQSSLNRCQSAYVVFFNWKILNATHDQGNLLFHTWTQSRMVFIPLDALLQTFGTN